jgi:hypothetical protein
MSRYKRGGWYGNSVGHSLAARGIRLYARKDKDAFFYAQKKEENIPMTEVSAMVRQNMTFAEMRENRPDVDSEVLRLRAIKVLDNQNGNNTLSFVNSSGVDESVRMAQSSRRFNDNLVSVLSDKQMSSFLPDIKIKALKMSLRGVR